MTRRGMAAVACCAAISIAGLLENRCGAAPRQTTFGTSGNTLNNGFFENTGVNFGFNIPASLPSGGRSAVVGLTPQGGLNPGGISFVQGGAAAALPPFGGFVPNEANTFGFTINSSPGSFNFGISASQGSSSSLSGQAAGVTVMDGGTGFIAAGSLRPFVTSVVPVVGGFAGGAAPQFSFPNPAPPAAAFGSSALAERLQRLNETPGPRVGPVGSATLAAKAPGNQVAAPDELRDRFVRDLVAARQSTAGQPAAAVAEIRAQQAAADEAAQSELQGILARAEKAKELGKPNVARIYYQQLARRATGALKQQALEGLKETELRR
jgi:hypothetical protein